MNSLCAALLMLFVVSSAHAEIFSAKVIAVLDGDTVLILHDGAKVKVRLANIDAPEVGHAGMDGKPPNSQESQAYGMESRDALVGMVLRKQVQVDSQAVDQYGRVVATLSVDGRNINEEQVQRGMAWAATGWRQSRRAPTGVPLAGANSHYHSDRHYIALQSEAQQARRGLWQDASPMEPWVWRKLHPATGPALHAAPPGALHHDKPVVLYDATCGHKKFCAQMSSCDEAHFYLTRCGVKTLDRNKDGVPCESLCR